MTPSYLNDMTVFFISMTKTNIVVAGHVSLATLLLNLTAAKHMEATYSPDSKGLGFYKKRFRNVSFTAFRGHVRYLS